MNRRRAIWMIGGGCCAIGTAAWWLARSDRDERSPGSLPGASILRDPEEVEQVVRDGIDAVRRNELPGGASDELAASVGSLFAKWALSKDPGEYVAWREDEGDALTASEAFARHYDLSGLFHALVDRGAKPPPDMREAFIALRKGALAHGNGANMPIGLDASEPVVVRTRLASLAEPAFPASSEGRPVLAGRRWFVPRVTLEDLIRRDTHVPVATVTLPVRHVDNSLVRYHVLLYFDAKTSQWLIDGIGLTEFDEATTSGLDY